MSRVFEDLLRARLEGVHTLSASQIARLGQHHELLSRWNQVLNLTSVRTLNDAVERHYCESLFAAQHLPRAVSIADIGSGGGFPGIPIAVARPDCSVTLVESHRRKAAFLREASRDLLNVRVLAQRAEEVAECFDWVVSRAVRYPDIAETLKKLAPNAELLTGEVRASDMPGFEWQAPIRLPWGDRRFLWIGNVPRETRSLGPDCFT